MGRDEAFKLYDLYDVYVDCGLGLPREKWKRKQNRIEYNNSEEEKQSYKQSQELCYENII